jgi:hypothetical protein
MQVHAGANAGQSGAHDEHVKMFHSHECTPTRPKSGPAQSYLTFSKVASSPIAASPDCSDMPILCTFWANRADRTALGRILGYRDDQAVSGMLNHVVACQSC